MSLSHKDEGKPQASNQSPEPQTSSLSILQFHRNISMMGTLGPGTLRCTGAKKHPAPIVSEPIRPQLEAYVLLGWQGNPNKNNNVTTTASTRRPFQGPDVPSRWAEPPPPQQVSVSDPRGSAFRAPALWTFTIKNWCRSSASHWSCLQSLAMPPGAATE